jgi:23S rRNA pseudouridine2605 synthase
MSTRKPASTAPRAAAPPDGHGRQRLQRVLAAAGLGSRRQCEELILAGRVEVDGRVVTELGSKADPRQQQIRVDGEPLPQPRRVYYLVHKPPGVVSTNRDPSGRPRVIDLVPHSPGLFAVGRLDLSSEGLILVTNDGDLANRLTHPRYGVEKTYQVEVAGTISRDDLRKLTHGVHLAEGLARARSARIKHQYRHSTLLEIVLAEGRNREIRRVLARTGHKVLRLKRVALGPLRLADLPAGAARPLARDEVRRLQLAAGAPRRKPPRPRRAPLSRPAATPTRTIIGADLGPGRAISRRRPGRAPARRSGAVSNQPQDKATRRRASSMNEDKHV